ncbi:hypothetical protein HAX54_015166, partial [Datura stramonium]|nr:hypothetical protein [Datura stramonium]
SVAAGGGCGGGPTRNFPTISPRNSNYHVDMSTTLTLPPLIFICLNIIVLFR